MGGKAYRCTVGSWGRAEEAFRDLYAKAREPFVGADRVRARQEPRSAATGSAALDELGRRVWRSYGQG
jgi:hypothetical protein